MNYLYEHMVETMPLTTMPAPFLVASVLAFVVHPILARTGFAIRDAEDAVAKVGFEIGDALLAPFVDAARQGVPQLANWLLDRMKTDPEVNEAAARTLALNLEDIAPPVLLDRRLLADRLRDGMKSIGGASATMADIFHRSFEGVDDAMAARLAMMNAIDRWASQSVEARRHSLIESVEQNIGNESRGRQTVSADQSTIRGVKQRLD